MVSLLRIFLLGAFAILVQGLSFNRESNALNHRQRRNVPRFTDPQYMDAFYINDNFGVTMNVAKSWSAGYTGKNVTVCVVDPQGVYLSGRDIASKYNAQASYDFNDNDTIPSTTSSGSSGQGTHGTLMAGLAAGKANNGFCSVGVAYDATISAIKIVSTGPAEEYGLRSAFSYQNNINDILLCSWGANGMTGQQIGYMKPSVGPAIKRAAEQGRNGKGNIILFSVGNGGRFNNSCSFDAYVSSIYTISISVVTGKNVGSRQNEKCPGISAVTYARDGSLGIDNKEDQMKACSVDDRCETSSSSSAANAVAAGIVALVLQANPRLGWRDMQHLIARSSCSQFNVDWTTNKAGLKVSSEFGFGLLDAYALIENAKNWNNVGNQLECVLSFNAQEPIHGVDTLTKTVDVTTWPTSCGGDPNAIRYLEHVVLEVNLNFTARKNLELELQSPTGTKSLMLRSGRVMDFGADIKNLPILTRHHWGESPKGVWTMKLRNVNPNPANKGVLFNWSLKFYGTKLDPMASNTVKPSQIRSGNTSTTMSPSTVSSVPNTNTASTVTARIQTTKAPGTASLAKYSSTVSSVPSTNSASTVTARIQTTKAPGTASLAKYPTTKAPGTASLAKCSPFIALACIFQAMLAIYW
eukprot:gene17262-18986_t